MYICQYCGKEFEKQQSYASHTGKCKLNPNRQKSLEHLEYARSCKEIDETIYFCQYCGKECKGKNSLVQHEIRCNENPNRIVLNTKSISNFVKYNEDCRKGIRHHPHKGQTKETCESLRKASETKRLKREKGELKGSFTGLKHSQETKEKMEEIQLAIAEVKKNA